MLDFCNHKLKPPEMPSFVSTSLAFTQTFKPLNVSHVSTPTATDVLTWFATSVFQDTIWSVRFASIKSVISILEKSVFNYNLYKFQEFSFAMLAWIAGT